MSTNLYCKPTDSHNYLLYSSEHPRHLLNGIPYSQFVRIKRLCSKPEDYRLNALMLSTHFIRRGYPKHLVLKALKRADTKTRDDLLNKEILTQKPAQNRSQKFYCVTTHNPQNPPLRNIIPSNWDILGKTKTTRPLLDSEIIFGLRRNKNLSDHLVRASSSTKPEGELTKTIDTRPCKRPNFCRYCPRLNTRLCIKKILFPVQRVAIIKASRAAAIFFFFHFIIFFHENIVNFWKKKKIAKMKKKVSSRTFLSHPAGLPETELFLWTALRAVSSAIRPSRPSPL